MRLAKGGLRRNFSSPPAYRPGFSLGQLCQVKRARVNRVPPRQEAFGLWDRRDSILNYMISSLMSDAAVDVRALGTMTTTGPTDHAFTMSKDPTSYLGSSLASLELLTSWRPSSCF